MSAIWGPIQDGVSSADVAADIAAALAAYQAADIGVRPVYTFTRTLTDNTTGGAVAPAMAIVAGSTGASGVFKIVRDGKVTPGTWNARCEIGSGEILVDGLAPVANGVKLYLAGITVGGELTMTYDTTSTGFDATLVLEVWKVW